MSKNQNIAFAVLIALLIANTAITTSSVTSLSVKVSELSDALASSQSATIVATGSGVVAASTEVRFDCAFSDAVKSLRSRAVGWDIFVREGHDYGGLSLFNGNFKFTVNDWPAYGNEMSFYGKSIDEAACKAAAFVIENQSMKGESK